VNERIRARRLVVSVLASILTLGGASSLTLLPTAVAISYPPLVMPPPVMPPVTPPVVAPVQIGSMSTALGVVLTSPSGNTLYTLSSDPNNGSA